MINIERRMRKSAVYSDLENGTRRIRELSRSFDTLADAQKFADGKSVVDIIITKNGKYKVIWVKTIHLD